jgi:hypothetical protein
MTKRTNWTKVYAEAPAADEERTVTLAEARAIGGMLGPIAEAMLKRHGVYGYKSFNSETKTERTILLRLA